MEKFVADQITSGIKYLPTNLVKSFFIPKSNEQTRKMRESGFACGVCHPSEDYEQIKNANIDWIRIDIPFPYEADGTISKSYIHFKETAKAYQDNRLKVMAVTPYPKSYIAYGADIREADGAKKVAEITSFIAEDMRDCVSGLQITNEMGIPIFTMPLNMDEAAKFIGVQLEAIYDKRGKLIIGYNCAGPQYDLHSRMKPYLKYCDYVGIDIYIGCFYNMGGFLWLYDALLRALWAFTEKPLILQEFGYMSGGKPKTKEEKAAILHRYGVSSQEEAREKIVDFVENLPPRLREHTKKICKNDATRYFNFLFHSDITNHLFCEMPAATKIPGMPHTPEGQAIFYEKILPRLYKKAYLCGANIYCYSDSEMCYICGQNDCPIETRWGLVTREGEPKPAYYAVQKAFGKILGK